MRKLLFIAMIALIVVSCEKEDTPDIIKSISLDKKSLPLMYNTTGIVTLSVEGIEFSDIEYTIKDKFVASADKYRDEIEVKGLHIGETYLIASYGNLKDSCKITVTPTDHIINEPTSLDFGSSKEVVKTKEKKTILSEDENSIRYEIDKYNSIEYLFEDGKLYAIRRWAGSFTFSQSDNILTEMYEYVKVENGILYKRGDLWVKLTRSQGGFSDIYYSNDSKILAKYKNVY